MIAIDWGTSSFRAFRLANDGRVLHRRSAPQGILHVEAGAFAATLHAHVHDWIEDGERRAVMAGMIGSRQGWVEAPYLPCPVDAREIGRQLLQVPFEGLDLRLVPGVSARDESGTPEVMRGEEVQILGVIAAEGLSDALICLPGTHSKWARLRGGRIEGFDTYMTGEVFAALRGHTILGRLMEPDGPPDPAAFAEGLARSAAPNHLLHHLFGVRTRGLFGDLPGSAAASYLSGLLIGHEVRAALPAPGTEVHLIGSESLCALYAGAVAACGGMARAHDSEAAARGLFEIGKEAKWA